MLLRSSSTPVLSSVFLQSESLKYLEPELSIGRSKSVQPSSVSSGFSSGSWGFEGEIHGRLRGGHRNVPVVVDRLEGEKTSISERKSDDFHITSSCVGTGSVGVGLVTSAGDNGKAHGSSGGRGGGRGRGSSGADSHGTDAYYQKMLEANPNNPLLLRNYAKFLHEVQHNLRKAEEYYERAILANPGDGEVLSLYAKLIWETHRDAPRAENYFDQAVQTAPDDCYVLASYAHFLWNSEDAEGEEESAALQHNISRPTFHESASAAVV